MTRAAKTTFQAELWMGPVGGTLVKLAELLTVTPPKRTREFEDATSHDSTAGAQEFIPAGTYDPGMMPFTIHHIADSATDVLLEAAFTDGDPRDFAWVSKKATGTKTRRVTGYLAEYGEDEKPTKGKATASGQIRTTGPFY